MREELKKKIEHSIALLRKGEKLATDMNPDGYWLAFSGGKDSQCIYELAKMSGVKFKAHFSNTTLEIPENVQFIRRNYPDVEHILPKKNFYTLLKEKNFMPTMKARWCCQELKEISGNGSCVVVGVRAEESARRSQYTEIYHHYHNLTQRERERERERERDGLLELENIYNNGIKYKNPKWHFNIILDWTLRDVLEFLDEMGVELNPCYEFVGRVGCIFCPYQSRKNLAFLEQKYPRHRDLYVKTIQWLIDNKGFWKGEGFTAEQIWEWWKSKESKSVWIAKQRQLELF